jgi:hypothetical protein
MVKRTEAYGGLSRPFVSSLPDLEALHVVFLQRRKRVKAGFALPCGIKAPLQSPPLHGLRHPKPGVEKTRQDVPSCGIRRAYPEDTTPTLPTIDDLSAYTLSTSPAARSQ